MNTTSNIGTALKYYTALLRGDFEEMQSYLHEEVTLISPLAHVEGQEAVVTSAKHLSASLEDIVFRLEFEKEKQVALVYDFMFKGPVGKLRASGVLSFDGGLIRRIELFYDGRPFAELKQTIFQK